MQRRSPSTPRRCMLGGWSTRGSACWGLGRLPIVEVSRGELSAAAGHATEAAALATATHDWAEHALASACTMQVAMCRSEFAHAEAEGELALQMYRRSDYAFVPPLVYPALAAARAARGDVDGANAALDDWATVGGRGLAPYRLLITAATFDRDALAALAPVPAGRRPTDRPVHAADPVRPGRGGSRARRHGAAGRCVRSAGGGAPSRCPLVRGLAVAPVAVDRRRGARTRSPRRRNAVVRRRRRGGGEPARGGRRRTCRPRTSRSRGDDGRRGDGSPVGRRVRPAVRPPRHAPAAPARRAPRRWSRHARNGCCARCCSPISSTRRRRTCSAVTRRTSSCSTCTTPSSGDGCVSSTAWR